MGGSFSLLVLSSHPLIQATLDISIHLFAMEADETSREVCYFLGFISSTLSRLFSNSCYAQLE